MDRIWFSAKHPPIIPGAPCRGVLGPIAAMIRCNVMKVLMRNIEPWEGILGVDLGILGVGSGSGSWE